MMSALFPNRSKSLLHRISKRASGPVRMPAMRPRLPVGFHLLPSILPQPPSGGSEDPISKRRKKIRPIGDFPARRLIPDTPSKRYLRRLADSIPSIRKILIALSSITTSTYKPSSCSGISRLFMLPPRLDDLSTPCVSLAPATTAHRRNASEVYSLCSVAKRPTQVSGVGQKSRNSSPRYRAAIG